jgi:hypothetical protein
VPEASRHGRPWSWLLSVGRINRPRRAREGRHPALVVGPTDPNGSLWPYPGPVGAIQPEAGRPTE